LSCRGGSRFRARSDPETPFADNVLYTKTGSGYFYAANALHDGKGADYTEIVASNDPAKKQEMIQRSGGRMTFPQVFIDGKHIGGSDDLHALDRKGELDSLLAA
jgi:glutaredoxin 3